jgi:hypothetical protein
MDYTTPEGLLHLDDLLKHKSPKDQMMNDYALLITLSESLPQLVSEVRRLRGELQKYEEAVRVELQMMPSEEKFGAMILSNNGYRVFPAATILLQINYTYCIVSDLGGNNCLPYADVLIIPKEKANES